MISPSSPCVALAVESYKKFFRCRAHALNALRVCGLLATVIILCDPAASAQDSVSFVRRSDFPTPRVTDIEIVRQQHVEIPLPELLADPERSRVLQLDLFADVSLRAVRERLEPTAHGVSWVGVLEGYPQSTVVFVLVDDGHCQVDEQSAHRPPRYWTRARREHVMLGVRQGGQPQLDNTGNTGYRNDMIGFMERSARVPR